MLFTHIDTACCLVEIGDIKILTDPVLDSAGGIYHHGYGAVSKKTGNPSLENVNLNEVDLILLSHPQHKDNFDKKGIEFARTVSLILSTPQIKKTHSNGKGLEPWDTFEYRNPNKNTRLKITATPAKHHTWLPQFVPGKVIGFFVENSSSDETLYISGDTVYFNGIDK